MPKDGGHYYDMYEHPLSGDQVTPEDVDRFPWPNPLDPARFAGLKEAAQQVHGREASGGHRQHVGGDYGDLRLVARLQRLLHRSRWQSEAGIAKFLDRILEMHIAYWDRVFEIVGDDIDVAMTADDFAGQQACSFRRAPTANLCKPRHKELFDYIHQRSQAKIFYHSCGAIRPVIPDLIEIGIDILNPVQVSAAGMDSAELKREFGKDITFWGGGVDTQRVLRRRHTGGGARRGEAAH